MSGPLDATECRCCGVRAYVRGEGCRVCDCDVNGLPDGPWRVLGASADKENWGLVSQRFLRFTLLQDALAVVLRYRRAYPLQRFKAGRLDAAGNVVQEVS